MTARHRIDRSPVERGTLTGSLADVWDGIVTLADALGDLPWTVVGGQMVYLHGVEHGVAPHRLSSDIDAAVDVRADRGGIRKLVDILLYLDFESAGTTPQGRAYRFEKRRGQAVAAVDVTVDERDDPFAKPLTVDVLAPENLGPRADLRTVGSGTAFPAPGIRKALARTELVPVSRDGVHWVPRPDLLGAIVTKATAMTVDHVDTQRHRADVAFLCGLVRDPFAFAEAVTASDRRRLRSALRAMPSGDRDWRNATAPADAYQAFEILAGT